LSPAFSNTDSKTFRLLNNELFTKSMRLSWLAVAFSSLPAVLLLAYGVVFAATALGTSLPVFDDHPGQLFRVWHVVQRGPAPWAWNPGWWAGYPEMQFYPPGFAYAGALLHTATLRLLSVEAAYQVLVWIAYLAPGVTAFWLLTRLLGDGWAALPGAFVALTLSAGTTSGVEEGVRVGMIAARLAWALLPLLMMAVFSWANGATPAPWAAVPVLLAGVALTHPTHLPAAVVVVLLAALAVTPRSPRLRQALLVLALGAGLTAFWTLPLVVRLGASRALAWGSLDAHSVAELVGGRPLLLLLLAGAATATAIAASPAERLVARMPWAMVLVVAVDGWLIEPLGFRWLPADRLADSAWLAVVLGAGFAAGRMLSRVSGGPAVRATSVAVVIGGLAALSIPGETLALWPRRADWPTYAQTARGLRLDALWSVLEAAPPGRILFVRSAVPLVHGSNWWRPHTHVLALTPLVTERAIVSGTFTHPSPVAAAFYRGTAGPDPITRLAEQLDGLELFGRPLESLESDTFTDIVDRLGVSAIVALEDDAPRLRGLDQSPELVRQSPLPPFIVYFRRSAVNVPRISSSGQVSPSFEGLAPGWTPARVAYYPLWRSRRGGEDLETRPGPLGDLEIRVGEGSGPIELWYAPGAAEYVGMFVSGAALLIWLARARMLLSIRA
jgi:hypothetical protein